MAHINEPKDVDFIIKSAPLTTEEKIAISKYISDFKLKTKEKKTSTTTKHKSVTKELA